MIDLAPPPPLWVPSRPAIIRPAPPADLRLISEARRQMAREGRKSCDASFMPGMAPGFSAASKTVRFVVGTPAQLGTDTNAYSFASTVFAAEAADRIVGVAYGSRANASRTSTGVNFGGVAADWFDYSNDPISTVDLCGIALKRLAAGTSITVQPTFSNTMLRCAIIPFTLYGVRLGTGAITPLDFPKDFGIPNLSVSAAARVGGIILAATWVGGTDHNLVFGGVTQDQTIDAETTGGELRLAHVITNGVSNINVTATTSGGSANAGALQTVSLYP